MVLQQLLAQSDLKVVLGCGIVGMVLTVGSMAFLSKMHQARKYANKQKEWDNIGKDTVVLHLFSRGNTCISLTPFVIKVELFLRMNNIKYVTETTYYVGTKGKTPWITFNAKNIADSQLIVEHLSKHFGIDMTSHLTAENKAIARSMRILLEDHLYWWLVNEKVCISVFRSICFCTFYYFFSGFTVEDNA